MVTRDGWLDEWGVSARLIGRFVLRNLGSHVHVGLGYLWLPGRGVKKYEGGYRFFVVIHSPVHYSKFCMNVLFAAAEAAPLLKKGGLGDVAGSLPLALHKLGVDVQVVLPWHPEIDIARWNVQERQGIGETRLGESEVPVFLLAKDTFATALGSGIQLDVGEEELLYQRFSESMIEFIRSREWKPEVLHGHDWHVSRAMALIELAPGSELHRWGYQDKANLATLFTIHNLGYFWTSLRQAVLTADIINTVSPSYAKEILTPEFCAELCQELQQRQEDLFGVLNGIDYGIWNPSDDQFLALQYGKENLSEGKENNKAALLQEIGMPGNGGLLVSFVGRLDPKQKGVDVLVQALDKIVSDGSQVVVLGTGDPGLENALRNAQEQYPDKVRVKITYDERLAHLIYAGSDSLVIPSKYEPCGLIQMIAMKYGTLPIAHAVGGLKDTIVDGENGFLFDQYSSEALAQAVERAREVFGRDDDWKRMVKKGMEKDFSWEMSAQEYVKLYQKAMGKSRK